MTKHGDKIQRISCGKMIRIRLNAEEKAHLEKMRTGGISRQSEKALMVLLSNEGLSPRKISQIIRRNAHTIRLWLKRYSLSKGT